MITIKHVSKILTENVKYKNLIDVKSACSVQKEFRLRAHFRRSFPLNIFGNISSSNLSKSKIWIYRDSKEKLIVIISNLLKISR
jgi:hypothetical protein